jgi:predicted nucleic-acid-binding protein
MIGLDTNIVVRYLVQDEPDQSECANRIIDKAVADKELLGISLVTLCETVWVLERCYNTTKTEIIEVLKQLLHTRQIQIEHKTVVWQALHDFECLEGIDFSDCLIGRQNLANDCVFTYTFDKNAAKKLNAAFKLATDAQSFSSKIPNNL